MAEKELSILVRAKNAVQAARDITKVDAAVSKLGKTSARGLSTIGSGITKGLHGAEKATEHLKGRLEGLAAPLGLIGLTAGVFTLTGAFDEGVHKAEDMALAVEKLTGVTGLSAHSASQVLAVFGRFGIEGDKVTSIAGFAEKTLGKLTAAQTKATKAGKSAELQQLELTKARRVAAGQSVTSINKLIAEQKARDTLTAAVANAADGSTKLAALEKTYGIVLTDNKGHAVDFATELNRVADYYVGNHTAAQKAALAATLFGKGYVSIIPVLKLGSKGIEEVSKKADELGLTLKSAQDVENVHKFIDAQRDAGEAIGGLEVQLGLLVMPDLAAGLKNLTGFLSTHHEDVLRFFGDGLHKAEDFAGFITGSVVPAIGGLASSAKGFWDSIPPPLRDFLFKAAVTDRTIKFLFGLSPIHIVAGIAEGAISKGLGGLLGAFTSRGSSPANPVFVAGGGVGGGEPVPTGGGLSGLKKLLLIGEAIALAGTVDQVRQEFGRQSTKQSEGIQSSLDEMLRKNPSQADIQQALGGVEQGIRDIKANPLLVLVQGDALTNLEEMERHLNELITKGVKQYGAPIGPGADGKPLGPHRNVTQGLSPIGPGADGKPLGPHRNVTQGLSPIGPGADGKPLPFTRRELRSKIGLSKDPKEVAKLQSTLDHRIERANKQAITVADAAKRAVTAAVRVAGDSTTGATRTGTQGTTSAVNTSSALMVSAIAGLAPGLAAAIRSLPAPRVNATVTVNPRTVGSGIVTSTIRASVGTGPTSASGT